MPADSHDTPLPSSRPMRDSDASVLDHVKDYWLSTRQVAEAAGLSEMAATVVLKGLTDQGRIETPRGTYLGVFWRRSRSGPPQGIP